MKAFTKTTKKQDRTISRLTKKYGCNTSQSELVKEDGSYYFKTSNGNGYTYIERDGKQYSL